MVALLQKLTELDYYDGMFLHDARCLWLESSGLEIPMDFSTIESLRNNLMDPVDQTVCVSSLHQNNKSY